MLTLSDKRLLLTGLRLTAQAMVLFLFYSYLSDTISPVVTAVGFLFAAAAGVFMAAAGFRALSACVLASLSALILRALFFFALGAVLSLSGSSGVDTSAADFMYFRFDSHFYPLFLPLLYIFMVNFLSRRRTGFIRVEVLLNGLLFVLILWKQGGFNITLFPHPGYLAIFSILFVLIEVYILVSFQVFRHKAASTFRAITAFTAIIIPALLVIMMLLFGRYSEGAAKDSGGLMQPSLLRFDFSEYVKLETEISMGNDLVMLLRNYGYLNSVYQRRFYLSGYKTGAGFFLQDGPGESPQLMDVPDRPVSTDLERFPERIRSAQEYFIINFDPSALIAMNYPVEISPLSNWNNSSFLNNYKVTSETVEMPSWELADAEMMELDSSLYRFYTDYGNDEEIKALAENVTKGLENYYDRVVAIMFYLRDSYFYSLKPGVAADGNQLHHFLFQSRKGYCSYFAFSMALMCRSIGIPARVAAGFFVDPQSGILNVYPVREDMAHAWVEVPFEGFGWVEFDPTSEQIAPGEDIEFSSIENSEYAGLVEEILANDYFVEKAQDKAEPDPASGTLRSFIDRLGRLILKNRLWLIPAAYTLYLVVFHAWGAVVFKVSGGRKKVKILYRIACSRLSFFGFKRRSGESVLEHAGRVDGMLNLEMSLLAEGYLSCVFSPDLSHARDRTAQDYRRIFKKNWSRLPVLWRAASFLFPFLRFRYKRGSVAAKALIFPAVLLVLSFYTSPPVIAQDGAGPETEQGHTWYLQEAEREIEFENYEGGLSLLLEGISLYPGSWELKKAAGDLYQDRELYNLALEQYAEALEISVDNPDLLYERSVVEGLLNLDYQSIHTLERLLTLVPDHYNALADLGWMYFKTYRLNEAEDLLLGAMEIYQDSPILYMTLGTVYSGKYDYDNAKKYYLEAIEMALEEGWNYFASVTYYNLSLLEYGFYQYEEALKYTNLSIETAQRAPGYISRAEIYLGRMDFEGSYQNYQQAYNIDSTPLALMGLADLYYQFGLLEEALSHIKEVAGRKDNSWMYYFGVDPDRHIMETDRIQMNIYAGMAEKAKFSPGFGIRRIKNLADSLVYRALSWYHERRYRKASYQVGLSNKAQGNQLDAAWAFYVANKKYIKPAEKYLAEARAMETAVAPGAEGPYLLDTGTLLKDIQTLEKAVAVLDPQWELREISSALAELIVLYRKNRDYKTAAALCHELYKVNPGVFIRKGIEFPIFLDFQPGFLLKKSLRRSGFKILKNNKDNDYSYTLSAADKQDRGVFYSVEEPGSGREIFSILVDGPLKAPREVSAFTADFKKRFFSTNVNKDDYF